MRIVFMGTPEFAVFALQKLLENKHEVVGVVTAPDQPAGRGKKIRMSAVKEFALKHELPVLQPLKLKDPAFIEELQALKADIQVVVAFRMLPEVVWAMPPKGTFNLHASLLPQYRGAAPINHVLINGETETGVTTFFLDKEIDTGKIILQEKCAISPDDNAGTLHDKLMVLGAGLILKTLQLIAANKIEPVAQNHLFVSDNDLKPAPKIFKQDCALVWNKSHTAILNKIRGLSPYPVAYSHLLDTETQKSYYLKIFSAQAIEKKYAETRPGSIFTDSATFLHVTTTDQTISLLEVQLEGKKKMKIQDFLRGFALKGVWCFKTLI